MRDPAPGGVIGYVAVHLPGLRAWQGFHVRADHRPRGEALLREAGGVTRDPRGTVGVADPLASSSPVDQPSIGALSALVARLCAMAVVEPGRVPGPALEEAIGGAAHALHLATGERWLLVTGTPDRGGGSAMRTQVERIEAASLDEAREAIAAAVSRTAEIGGLVEGFGAALRRVERGRPA